MDIYREELIDHYHNPRNYGQLVDADVIIELENVSCGDKIQLWLKVKNDVVQEVSFEGEGCAIVIAAASILTDYAKGKPVSEIKKLTYEQLQELLKVQLTPSRVKCATLGLETMQKALKSVDHKH